MPDAGEKKVTAARIVLAILFGSGLMSAHSAESPDPLANARWQHRILLVFAAEEEQQQVQSFRAKLSEVDCELVERDLIVGWFLRDGTANLDGDAVERNYVTDTAQRVGVADREFAVVLIGKDGGIKSRYSDTPDLYEIFRLIDGMPMRQSEMRSGSECNQSEKRGSEP